MRQLLVDIRDFAYHSPGLQQDYVAKLKPASRRAVSLPSGR